MALLIPFPWLIYRKMYVYAAIYFVVSAALPLFAALMLHITFALVGTYLYFQFASRKIANISSSGDERNEEIMAKGGVMPIPLVVGIVIGISVLFSMIFFSVLINSDVANNIQQEMKNDMSQLHESVDEASALQVIMLKQAINMYLALSKATGKNASPPSSVEELKTLFNMPAESFQDSWGTEIEYKPTAQGFELRSAGPDKEFDSADDVVVDSEIE